MDFNLLISTLIGGGLALLSFLKMTNALQVNRKANFYFGIFCLLWASFWLDGMIDQDFLAANFGLAFLLKVAQFLVGLVFFLSVRFYTNPDFRFSKSDLRMLAAPVVFIGVLLYRPESEMAYNIVYLVLFLGHSMLYVLLSFLTIRRHQRNIERFASNIESIDLRWIKYIIYSFILSLVVVILYNIFQMRQPLNFYINFHLLAVVYFVAFFSIRQKEIFPKGLAVEAIIGTENELTDPVRKTRLMDDDEMLRLKSRLIYLIESEELFLDCELNLLKLSERLQVSTHQLSYVINNGAGENFFNFINRFRVKKAEALLSDAGADHLTIVGIGFESGFNSKTAFNTAFKKITGFTPTEFRKMRPGFENIQLAD